MSIPPPRELTPQDWQDAWRRSREQRERERRHQRYQQINQEINTRFTSGQQELLRELKEKVNPNENIILIDVKDERDGLLSIEKKEIVGGSKQIKISKNENYMEEEELTSKITEQDIKRMEIEPEPELEEDHKIKELENFTAEDIDAIFSNIEQQRQMEEEEQTKVIELKDVEKEYGEREEEEREAIYTWDIAVKLKDIITFDKETDPDYKDIWSENNSESMKIRFIFDDKYEICAIVWNKIVLKKNKINIKTDYDLYIVNPEGKRISLKRNQEWFQARKERIEREIENRMRELEEDPEYNYISPERLVGLDQFIILAGATGPQTAEARLAVYNSEFIKTIEVSDDFEKERSEKIKKIEKKKSKNEFMNYILYKGHQKVGEELEEYAKLNEECLILKEEYKNLRTVFDTVFDNIKRINNEEIRKLINQNTSIDDYKNPEELRNLFLSVFGKEKTEQWEEKIILYFQLYEKLKKSYKRFNQLYEMPVKILENDLNGKIPDKETVSDWGHNGDQKIYNAENEFYEWERKTYGKTSKKRNPPFEVQIFTHHNKRGIKERKVIIHFQFEDSNQYEKIKEIFSSHKLENIIMKFTKRSPKDIEYFEEYSKTKGKK